MTNREFYKEQILDVACAGHSFGIDKTDNMIHACCEIGCSNCLFNYGECCDATEKWCNAEHVESCPFKKGELVEVSHEGKRWELGYFSHIEDGIYYTFMWGNNVGYLVDWEYCRKYGTFGGLVKE